MSQEKQTIEACWPVARAMALHFQEMHNGRGGSNAHWFRPQHWNGEGYVAAAWAEPGVIEYRLNQGADVRLVNIKIADVMPEDIDIGPIIPTGPQRTVRADIISIPNNTLQDLPRTLTYRDMESHGTAQQVAREMGASIAVGLRQSIGYGSEIYGIQGETELTVNIEASFKQAWESAMTSSYEHEMESVTEYVARALHDTRIERVEEVGPCKQTIKAKGELKFGFRLHSRGDFVYTWPTTPIFLAQAIGIETEGDNSWTGFYRNHPSPDDLLGPIRAPVYATVERIREFEEARNIKLVPTETPLNDTARLQDALKLVSLKADSPELRRLAEAALKAA